MASRHEVTLGALFHSNPYLGLLGFPLLNFSHWVFSLGIKRDYPFSQGIGLQSD
jgi:hypothetical protein